METIKDIDEKERKVAIDIVKANIFAVAIMIIATIVLLGPFYLIWGECKPMMEMLGSGTQWGVALVAMFIGNLPLLAWGILFIAAAAGDIWMTWLLTKENPKSMVLVHPSEAGFYIID